MKWRKRLSHQELREAVQQFVNSGGIISKLPEQKQVRSDYVGNDKYDTYEPLAAFAMFLWN